MQDGFAITNARVVTPEGVREKASVHVENGRIARIGEGSTQGIREIDAGGNILFPGFVDMHSDAIEKGIAGYISPDTIVDGNIDYDFYLGTCTTGGVCTPDAGIGSTISVIISGSINSTPVTSAKTFDY